MDIIWLYLWAWASLYGVSRFEGTFATPHKYYITKKIKNQTKDISVENYVFATIEF